jgi:hypothetical protein
VGIDNGCRVIFFGNFKQKIINYIRCIRIKPELGSSQKRYFGLLTIALAMATLFCIPPEISDGNFRLALSRCTLPITSKTLFSFL